MSEPRLSVLMVTGRRRERVRVALEALAAQTVVRRSDTPSWAGDAGKALAGARRGYSARMPGRNGRQKPPRPQIEVNSANASPDEAAAIAAALERFLWETAPAPREEPRSRWLEAALREAVCARPQLDRGWGLG